MTQDIENKLRSRYKTCNQSGHKNIDEGMCGYCFREIKPTYWHLVENNPGMIDYATVKKQRQKEWEEGLELLALELGESEKKTTSTSLQVQA